MQVVAAAIVTRERWVLAASHLRQAVFAEALVLTGSWQ